MADQHHIVLGLDVGSKRIGVALSDSLTRLPKPLQTLQVSDQIIENIIDLIKQQNASVLVIGLPRNLEGNSTDQTRSVELFARRLRAKIDIPVYFTDEAVTSVQAEAQLRARGRPYAKGDIDALAAVFILEDFLNAHQKIS